MCVNDNWVEDESCEGHPRPSFGDIDEVIDECWNQIEYYELARFPLIIFAKSNFIPLSNIDELQLTNSKEI